MKLQIGKFKLDLVLLLVGICPVFFFGRSPDMQAQQIMFLHFMTVLMLACVLCNRWLGGFLLLALAHKFLFVSVGWIDYVLPLSVGLLLYHLVYTYYDGKKYPYVILAMLVFNLCIAGLQTLHIPWLSQQMLQPDGMLSLPSFLGMVFAMTAPVIMTIHPMLIVVSLLGVIVSKSAFAAVATGAGVLFYVHSAYPRFWKRGWVFLVLIPVFLVPVVKRGVSGEEMSRMVLKSADGLPLMDIMRPARSEQRMRLECRFSDELTRLFDGASKARENLAGQPTRHRRYLPNDSE